MRSRRIGRALMAGTAGLAVGCVDRRFVVETNMPGAQINFDGKPIGPSPADGTYDFAGNYTVTAVAPGCEPLTQVVRLRPKWYDYPPLDFIAEGLWPFRIEDVRRIRLDLQKKQPVPVDQLLSGAEALRARSATLPPPSVPDDDGRPGVDVSNGGAYPFVPGPPLPTTASIPGATTVPGGTISQPPGYPGVPQSAGVGPGTR